MTLKAARTNANIKQKEAAKLLKINVSTLSGWENGRSTPDVIKFKEMCVLYNTPMDDIFFASKINFK